MAGGPEAISLCASSSSARPEPGRATAGEPSILYCVDTRSAAHRLQEYAGLGKRCLDLTGNDARLTTIPSRARCVYP
jgi:hypothetical protein